MSIEEKIAAAEKCKADVTVAFKVGDFAAPEEDEDDIPVSQLRLRHPLLRPPKKMKRTTVAQRHLDNIDRVPVPVHCTVVPISRPIFKSK